MNKDYFSIIEYLQAQGFRKGGSAASGDGWVQVVLTRHSTHGYFESISMFAMLEHPPEEEELEEEELEQEEETLAERMERGSAYKTKETTKAGKQESKERG